MDAINSLAVIGPGKVGTAIAVSARRHGIGDVFIGGRHQDRVEEAVKLASGAKACRVAEAARHADIVLICVSDNAIALVAKQLAEEDGFRKGAVVAHVSGALESSILQPAKELCGAFIASAHPLNTYPSIADAADEKPGTHWFLEGDSEAVSKLTALISRMHDQAHAITGEGKAIYHAASVFACNYLSTLMDTALEMMEQAGIDKEMGWSALRPLVFATMTNINKMGPEAALTGPISRGDLVTVERHMQAMKDSLPEMRKLYAALGLKTVHLARRKGSIDDDAANKIAEKLQQMF